MPERNALGLTFPERLHFGDHTHSLPKQTVPEHLVPHHSSYHGTYRCNRDGQCQCTQVDKQRIEKQITIQ